MDEQKLDFSVSDNQVEEAVNQEVYLQVGFKTSLCVLMANTGYEAVGRYSPVDASNVDIALGKKLARANAFLEMRNHLEGIAQWRKAVNDLRFAQEQAEQKAAQAAAQATQDVEKETPKGVINLKK